MPRSRNCLAETPSLNEARCLIGSAGREVLAGFASRFLAPNPFGSCTLERSTRRRNEFADGAQTLTQDGLQSGPPSVQSEAQATPRDAVNSSGAAASSGRSAGTAPGSSSNGVGRYDFERLERAVTFLLQEHERLSSEKSELLEELVGREQRLTALESQLSMEQDRRTKATEGVDKILGRLEQLQSSATSAMDAGMEPV